MADIKQAIEYAKQNPDSAYATELRTRIQSGAFNKELNDAGLTQFIPKTSAPVVEPAKTGSDTGNDIRETGSAIKKSFTDAQAKAKQTVSDYKSGKQGLGSSILQGVGQAAGVIGDTVGDAAIGIGKALLSQKAEDAVGKLAGEAATTIQNDKGVQDVTAKYKAWAEKHPEASKDLGAVVNIASVIPAFEGANAAADGAKIAGTAVKDATKAGVGAIDRSAVGVVDGVVSKISKSPLVKDTLARISEPEVSQATKASLNPIQALKDTGQDMKVTVGGKVKNLSEVTDKEARNMQISTEKNINNFTAQAEKFSKDRSVPGGSPVETVGSRTDKALDFADKKRQTIGSQMGEIENKYSKDQLPISEKTFNTFANLTKLSDESTYGVKSTNADVVTKLVKDFDTLEKNGATISERNDFVRRWQTYIQDQKDNFGKFTENKYANGQIEKAVNSIKNETVDHISENDKVYKNLRKQYAEYSKLQEIGNGLLGKDGALGERVKGAATVKRAIQSNSDAGARQFLTKLRDLTGYDAIKEGDLALTAMESVGDYQGLSLLNIIKEGKTGLINKGLEKAQDLLVGSKTKRIKNYIKK